MKPIAVIVVLLGSILGMSVGRATAQAPVAQPIPPAYVQLIEAGKLAQRSEALTKASNRGATLTEKRISLADLDVINALRTFREWLNVPNRTLDVGSFDPIVQKGLVPLHSLSRALTVEQYVLLADGRISEAIQNMRAGLRLSCALKPNSMVVWAMANSLDIGSISPIARHLDQLSRSDCDRLFALAQEVLAYPDPTSAMLDCERAAMRKNAETYWRELLTIPEAVRNTDQYPPLTEAEKKMATEAAALSSVDFNALWSTVEARVDKVFAHEKANLAKPLWEQEEKPVLPPGENASLADRFFWEREDVWNQLFEGNRNSYGRQLTKTRMLGCHALIHAYLWEHDRLPATLAELKAGDLAIDPFNGKELMYTLAGVDKRSYTLLSIGPPVRDDNGNIKPGERVPFAVMK